mgnify:CR=1 FL=1
MSLTTSLKPNILIYIMEFLIPKLKNCSSYFKVYSLGAFSRGLVLRTKTLAQIVPTSFSFCTARANLCRKRHEVLTPTEGGTKNDTQFWVFWLVSVGAWCCAPKPPRSDSLVFCCRFRGGAPVLQRNTRFSVLLKAPRHKKMRGLFPI